jgi:hypothetical protein
MPKRLFLFLSALMLVASPLCLGEDQTWVEMKAELQKAKLKVSDVVGEILAANPSEMKLRLLREKYNLAREAYSDWATEAADAVQHGHKINFNSKKAKLARSRLNELGAFHDDYFKGIDKQTNSLNFGNPSNGPSTSNIPQYVNLGLTIFKEADAAIQARREQIKKEREAAANVILASAEWSDFNALTNSAAKK